MSREPRFLKARMSLFALAFIDQSLTLHKLKRTNLTLQIQISDGGQTLVTACPHQLHKPPHSAEHQAGLSVGL